MGPATLRCAGGAMTAAAQCAARTLEAATRQVRGEMFAYALFVEAVPDVSRETIDKMCGWIAQHERPLSFPVMMEAWKAVT